jgi:hypothetical protein
VRLLFGLETAKDHLNAVHVIARSEATKQSRQGTAPALDCFALRTRNDDHRAAQQHTVRSSADGRRRLTKRGSHTYTAE